MKTNQFDEHFQLERAEIEIIIYCLTRLAAFNEFQSRFLSENQRKIVSLYLGLTDFKVNNINISEKLELQNDLMKKIILALTAQIKYGVKL